MIKNKKENLLILNIMNKKEYTKIQVKKNLFTS